MERWQSTYIIRNLPSLQESTTCDTSLLTNLWSNGIISKEDKQEIETRRLPLEKANKLYEIILTRTHGYLELMKGLQKGKQTGAFNILMEGVSSIGVSNLRVAFHENVKTLGEMMPEAKLQEISDNLKSSLSPEEYIDLVLNNQAEKEQSALKLINDTIPSPLSYYVKRELSTRTNLSPYIFKAECPDVFVFTNMERFQLTKLASPKPTTTSGTQLLEITCRFIMLENQEHWEQIRKKAKCPIHLIKFDGGKDMYFLKESCGSITTLQQYLNHDEKLIDCPTFFEKEFVALHQRKGAPSGVCICDTPGMGKSKLLENLAREMIKRENTIAAYISLSAILQNLSVQQSKDKNDILSHIIQYICPSIPAQHILIRLIKNNSITMVLCFDGFDEIKEGDVARAEKMLQNIIQKFENVKVFVTSRPHTRKQLETVLGTIAYDIIPFTEPNQIDFLSEYWKFEISQDCDTDKLRDFARLCLQSLKKTLSKQEHDIMGIPLQCFFLAEVYMEHAKLYSREMLSSESIFENELTVHEMYKRFLDLRFSAPHQSKPNSSKLKSARNVLKPVLNTANKLYSKFVQPGLKYDQPKPLSPKEVLKIKYFHIFKALQLLFPDIADKCAKYFKITDMDTTPYHFTFGVLEARQRPTGEDEPVFLHRTIAEFLVADFFSTLLTNKMSTKAKQKVYQENMLKFFVNNVLQTFEGKTVAFGKHVIRSSFKYFVIHFFLNGFLKNTQNYNVDKFVASAFLNSLQPKKILSTLAEAIHNNFIYMLVLLKEVVKLGNHERIQEFRNGLFNNDDWKNCLHLCNTAAENSDLDLVKEYFNLLKEGFRLDVNELWNYDDECTPLECAIKRNNYDMVEFIANHVGLCRPYTLYHCVRIGDTYKNDLNVTRNRLEMFKLLLSKNPNILIDSVGQLAVPYSTENIVHSAARYFSPNGIDEFCRILIEDQQALYLFDTNLPKWTSPLYTLLSCDHVVPNSLITTIMGKLDVDKIVKAEEQNLVFAALTGRRNLSIVKFLIDRGADDKFKNKDGYTALHGAAAYKNSENCIALLQYFLSRGLKINEPDNSGNTPLLKTSGDLDVIKCLVLQCANVRASNKQGRNIAHNVAKWTEEAVFHSITVYLLKECNAAELYTVKSIDRSGETPIHSRLSCKNISVDTLQLLLSTPGVDVNSTDELGNNLFLCAVEGEQPVAILKVLVEHGADCKSSNYEDENALHICFENGYNSGFSKHHVDIVRYLLSQDLNVYQPNNKQKPPIYQLIKHLWDFGWRYIRSSNPQFIEILDLLEVSTEMREHWGKLREENKNLDDYTMNELLPHHLR